ncbi:MAG: response regulator [Pirellulales bacterium]
MKTVFTTGEAAKICKVSQQTIIRCFDSGQLKGFRVPGSRFRRIPRDQLYAFMKDNGIPTDALESGKRKVLLVDDDAELVELISDVLEKDGRFEVRIANNGFDAGMLVKEYGPDLIVLDVMLPDINGKEVCQRVRKDHAQEEVKIICISGMVEEDKIADLKAAAQTTSCRSRSKWTCSSNGCAGCWILKPRRLAKKLSAEASSQGCHGWLVHPCFV